MHRRTARYTGCNWQKRQHSTGCVVYATRKDPAFIFVVSRIVYGLLQWSKLENESSGALISILSANKKIVIFYSYKQWTYPAEQQPFCRESLHMTRASESLKQPCMMPVENEPRREESTHVVADELVIDHDPVTPVRLPVLPLPELLEQEPVQNAGRIFPRSTALVQRDRCPPLFDSTVQHLRRGSSTENKGAESARSMESQVTSQRGQEVSPGMNQARYDTKGGSLARGTQQP